MISLLPLLFSISLAQGTDTLDVLILRGTVYDGSGAPSRVADVGIRGDRIVFVGDAAQMPSRRVIMATGLIVAPGFIDPHNHLLAGLPGANENARRAPSALMQG